MRDEITINKKDLTEKLLIASSRASAMIGDKTKNKPQVTMVTQLLNTILVGEIIKILFDEDDLIITDDV